MPLEHSSLLPFQRDKIKAKREVHISNREERLLPGRSKAQFSIKVGLLYGERTLKSGESGLVLEIGIHSLCYVKMDCVG